MSKFLEVQGLEEIIQRMSAFPQKLNDQLRLTMDAGLLILWESVPPYPPKPAGSTYDRQGTLGKTLGVDMSGGMAGHPDIYEVRHAGGYYEGSFGTNLEYAPYVIGDPGTEQAGHMTHWWTLVETVAEAAIGKLEALFQQAADRMASWLDGRGY